MHQKLCHLSRRLSTAFPAYTEEKTFFSLLGLDPFQPPFWPLDQSGFISGSSVEAAEAAIIEAWTSAGGKASAEGLSSDKEVEQYLRLVNLVANEMLNFRSRAIYTSRFLDRGPDGRQRTKWRVTCEKDESAQDQNKAASE